MQNMGRQFVQKTHRRAAGGQSVLRNTELGSAFTWSAHKHDKHTPTWHEGPLTRGKSAVTSEGRQQPATNLLLKQHCKKWLVWFFTSSHRGPPCLWVGSRQFTFQQKHRTNPSVAAERANRRSFALRHRNCLQAEGVTATGGSDGYQKAFLSFRPLSRWLLSV